MIQSIHPQRHETRLTGSTSLEELLGLLEETFLHAAAGRFTKGEGEGFKMCFLFGAELGGHGDGDVNVEIAVMAFAKGFDALAPEAEGRAILGAGGNLEVGFAIQGGDGGFATKSRCAEAQRHLAMKIITLTLEEVVGFDLDDDVEIASRATFGTIVTVAA